MAEIKANLKMVATIPDAVASDPEQLAAAIVAKLSQIVAIAGVDSVHLELYGIGLES